MSKSHHNLRQKMLLINPSFIVESEFFGARKKTENSPMRGDKMTESLFAVQIHAGEFLSPISFLTKKPVFSPGALLFTPN